MREGTCVDCGAAFLASAMGVMPVRCRSCYAASRKVKRQARNAVRVAGNRERRGVRACLVCRVEFVPRQNGQLFCSEKCNRRETVRSGRQNEYNRRSRGKLGSARYPITCQMCGLAAMVTAPTVRFCSNDCWLLWRLEHPQLDKTRRKWSSSTVLVHLGSVKDFPDPRELIERPCLYCLRPIVVQRRSHQRYCGEGCADGFNKYGRARQHDDGRNWTLLVSGPCVHCRQNFTGQATSVETAPKYCSKACGGSDRKARPFRFRISDVHRQQIYERDKFICQLCKDPVDMTLASSDRWAATLDHIIPQSHQLVPDHSPGNLRLAHRWCNSVRGDLSTHDDSFFAA